MNLSSINFCGNFSSPFKILAFKEPDSSELHNWNVVSVKSFHFCSSQFHLASLVGEIMKKKKKKIPIHSFIISVIAYKFIALSSPGCRDTGCQLLPSTVIASSLMEAIPLVWSALSHFLQLFKFFFQLHIFEDQVSRIAHIIHSKAAPWLWSGMVTFWVVLYFLLIFSSILFVF